ncbi:uncharacterized protein LOC131300179 [Rhododendron vialii]|uniref:uncharacterized protein LOC131300179 n=1 Tax=Rhododendron vialii TaxID=182163 RepID=UPI00265E0FDB|nr:uncharacterized protein LOC131300179 [Rhododendron vialii]
MMTPCLFQEFQNTNSLLGSTKCICLLIKDWFENAMELRRINTNRLLQWNRNELDRQMPSAKNVGDSDDAFNTSFSETKARKHVYKFGISISRFCWEEGKIHSYGVGYTHTQNSP